MFDEKPTDELRAMALLKNKKGNATSLALQAQRVLCKRAGKSYRQDRAKTTSDDYGYGEPEMFTKKFK